MTLNELRYIAAVARERHFGHAADSCFVSQPTLSVAVKKLEDELGVSLFERGGGEVLVTDVGWQVVEQAQRVLEEAGKVKQIARQGTDPLIGSLRLGAIYTVGPYLLPYLIPRVMARAPDMPLVIEENYTAVLTERLKGGDLDVIVISLPFDETGVVTRNLYAEDLMILLPGSHPLSGQSRIAVEQLAEENVLLLGPGHCFRDQVLQACPECLRRSHPNGARRRNLEGGSLETIRCMVAGGVGVTVLPRSAAGSGRFPPGILMTLPFAGTAPQRHVALAWRKSFPRATAIDVLADAVIEAPLDGVVVSP